MSEAGTRRTAVRGAGSIAAGVVVGRAVALLSALSLARLLVPEEFGVFAFAVSIVGLAGQLANFEARRDIIRNPARAAARARGYTAVQGIVGAALGLAFLLLGQPLGRALGRPEAGTVLAALAAWPLLDVLRLPPAALLESHYRFGALATMEWSGAILRASVAITFAALGAGVWSLVAGLYFDAALRLVATWLLEGGGILKARCDKVDLRSVRTFGIPLLAGNLAAAWFWRADDILVGALLGMGMAGLYSIAFTLPFTLLRLTDGLASVALSVLSRHPDAGEQSRAVEMAVRVSFALTTLPLVVGFVHGEALIRPLLGPGWEGATATFVIFLVVGVLRGTLRYWEDLASVRERPGMILRTRLMSGLLLPPLGYLGIEVGGIEGMALAVLVAWAVPSLPCAVWMLREMSIRLDRALGPGAAAAAVALALGLAARELLPGSGAVRTAAVALLQTAAHIGTLFLVDRDLTSILRSSLGREEKAR